MGTKMGTKMGEGLCLFLVWVFKWEFKLPLSLPVLSAEIPKPCHACHAMQRTPTYARPGHLFCTASHQRFSRPCHAGASGARLQTGTRGARPSKAARKRAAANAQARAHAASSSLRRRVHAVAAGGLLPLSLSLSLSPPLRESDPSPRGRGPSPLPLRLPIDSLEHKANLNFHGAPRICGAGVRRAGDASPELHGRTPGAQKGSST